MGPAYVEPCRHAGRGEAAYDMNLTELSVPQPQPGRVGLTVYITSFSISRHHHTSLPRPGHNCSADSLTAEWHGVVRWKRTVPHSNPHPHTVLPACQSFLDRISPPCFSPHAVSGAADHAGTRCRATRARSPSSMPATASTSAPYRWKTTTRPAHTS